MFQTIITRSAAQQVKSKKEKLKLSQIAHQQTAKSIKRKSNRFFSQPIAILISFVLGVFVVTRSARNKQHTIKVAESNEELVLTENNHKLGYLSSIVGTIASAASLYLRVSRAKKELPTNIDENGSDNGVTEHA